MHTITQKEATAIHQVRVAAAKAEQAAREKEELDAWYSAMEIKYRTQ